MKNLFVFIVLLALCGYLYSTYGEPVLTKIQQAQEAAQEQTPTEDTPVVTEQAPDPAVWTFQEQAAQEGIPQTEVILSYNNVSHVLGVHAGSCFLVEESGWELLQHEETGVICYFAGGGTELGVFNRDGVITVEQGAIEEGSAEVPGLRGDFTIIKAL